MSISYDDKIALLDRLPAVEALAFSDPPVSARGRAPIAWEDHLTLDVWRANTGKGAAILPVVMHPDDTHYAGEVDDKATSAIRSSIISRLAKVFPEESWTTYVADGFIWLKYNGGKVKRAARAA